MSQEQVDAITIHDKDNIKGFFGEYRFLSNFHLAEVIYEGDKYPSNENAFQAAKTNGSRGIFITCPPSVAKNLGKKVKLREDWEEVKVAIMFRLTEAKFTKHPELKEALLNTGDKYLEETNWWNDTFWGVCNGVGENKLGKILMAVRANLRMGLI